MVRKLFAVFSLATAALLPVTSQAIVVKIDEADQTVTRLASGYLDVAYTGTITVTDGYELLFQSATSLWNASGDLIAGVFPHPNFGVDGVLFTVRYDASDFGLYGFDVSLMDPARFNFAECQIGGGFCNNAGGTFSLNIVDSIAVPEPTTLTLLGSALLAFAVAGRRRFANMRG